MKKHKIKVQRKTQMRQVQFPDTFPASLRPSVVKYHSSTYSMSLTLPTAYSLGEKGMQSGIVESRSKSTKVGSLLAGMTGLSSGMRGGGGEGEGGGAGGCSWGMRGWRSAWMECWRCAVASSGEQWNHSMILSLACSKKSAPSIGGCWSAMGCGGVKECHLGERGAGRYGINGSD